MADLLECLLQIKGLQATIERLAALAADKPFEMWAPSAAVLVARLAELEMVHGASIRLMLTEAKPALPDADPRTLGVLARRHQWTARRAFETFAGRRRDNLELLDACSADDLSRVGMHASRRAMTLADLVAVMLAGDVEHVGEIREALRPQALGPDA